MTVGKSLLIIIFEKSFAALGARFKQHARGSYKKNLTNTQGIFNCTMYTFFTVAFTLGCTLYTEFFFRLRR
jgi:hypothetical protein